MTLKRLPVKQNTDEWLAIRRTGVTSSMLPVITGNRAGILQLWSEHVGLLEPQPPDEDQEELFALGHALEPVIAVFYTRKTKRPIKKVEQLVRHVSIPWAYASLDRVSAVKGERRVVELKYAPHRWEIESLDDIAAPASVQDQVQWQLLVTGYEVADVAVLHRGKVEVVEIPANATYQANLLTVAEWFHELVLTRTPPPVDESEATRKTLQRLYPRDTEGFLPPSPELAALAFAVRDAMTEAKAAKAREDRVKNALRSALQDHAGVESDELGFRVTWRKQKDSVEEVTNWEGVARAYRWLLDAQADRIELPAAAADTVMALEQARRPISPADLDTIVGIMTDTITTPGARVLRVRTRDEGSGKWV